jgi:thiamine pyrophosphate-dependent acetolactate synthase large subunit-like protein
MKAGQAVLEALRAEGVEYTFGVVGTTTNSIVTEMYGRSDIRFVDTRHEEGAAFMAYGYARASGKATACITTSGPGTTNLVTGVALAYKGRAPVIVIAGDVARDYIYRDGAQAFDLVGLFKPITKLALEVNKTERIPEMLQYAFRSALSGKQGPAFLDIPRDLLDDQTVAGEPLRPGAYRAVETRIAGDAQAIQRAAALLAQAQRPLLLAGGGIIDAEASKEAVALAELLDMALVPSYGHNDVVPNSHHLYVGPPGGRGSAEAAEALHRADVILALGTRLNQATTFWDYRVINRETKIVQVDIDAQEIGRNYPVAVGIVGDARAVAEQLLRAVRETHGQGSARSAWRSEVAGLAARRQARLQAELSLTASPMMPQRVFPELARARRVLRRRRRRDDRGVDNGPRAHRDAVRAQMAGDGLEHRLAEPVLFEEVAELADRRLIGHRLAAQVDADERAHGRRVVQRFLHGRVREIEPVLEEVHPQHALEADRRPAVVGIRVHGLDAGTELAPRHHALHLGQELHRRVTFVYFSKPVPASVSCERFFIGTPVLA